MEVHQNRQPCVDRSNATILPVTICDHVVVGAGSVVTQDIVNPGIYAGNPCHKLDDLP